MRVNDNVVAAGAGAQLSLMASRANLGRTLESPRRQKTARLGASPIQHLSFLVVCQLSTAGAMVGAAAMRRGVMVLLLAASLGSLQLAAAGRGVSLSAAPR